MREMIYYPGFEVSDPDWLKFALLYLRRLRPIIPDSGDALLTEEYRRLIGETDLISVHRPSHSEGTMATLDALEVVERVLQKPQRYQGFFQEPNIVEAWRDPRNHTSVLFQEKYTDDWERFCMQHGLATRSGFGLRTSDHLSLVYMTILAQVIADSRGVSPITDRHALDHFATYVRRAEPQARQSVQTAQAVLRLSIPADISNISMDAIIAHRNRPGFEQRQRAFHDHLNSLLSDLEAGSMPTDFRGSLGNWWSDLGDDIAQLGPNLTTIGLGVWLVLRSSSAGVADAALQISGAASIAIGAATAIRKSWTHSRPKRLARRYLADLQQFAPAG